MTSTLSAAQLEALQRFAAKHGRYWKQALRNVWAIDARIEDAAILRQLRNDFGPTWLKNFRMPECQPL